MTAKKEMVYRWLRWVFWLGMMFAWGTVVLAEHQHETRRAALIVAVACSLGGLIVVTLQMFLPPKSGDEQ
jgi:hypothetical protein